MRESAEARPDRDNDYDQLYSFGGRSFSIRDAAGQLVYDSGQQLEEIVKAAYPTEFDSDNAANASFDSRSDNKGPEPEGVAVGRVRARWYAFIGLERMGGVAVFDIQNPASPVFQQYINPRDLAGNPALDTAGDLGPEGLQFVPAKASPIGQDLLIVGNEISGSTAVYAISVLP